MVAVSVFYIVHPVMRCLLARREDRVEGLWHGTIMRSAAPVLLVCALLMLAVGNGLLEWEERTVSADVAAAIEPRERTPAMEALPEYFRELDRQWREERASDNDSDAAGPIR